MNSNRRDFLKLMAAGAAGAVTALAAGPVQARPLKPLAPGAIGILYDATLCIGCKACEVACKSANQMPMDHASGIEELHGVSGVWDAPDDLNSRTLNKIKLCATGDGSQGGFSFVRRACMHCVDPNCVSACPVSALTKDPVTGIVRYNPDACIGCRYCQLACPFNVPKFEFDQPFPKIVKCQLCTDRVSEGEVPACCAACPTGASLFGPVTDLLAEGHRRLAFQPGETRDYPLHWLGSHDQRTATVTGYVPGIYGESEAGGTQHLLMAGVPFDQLGLPRLGNDSRARLSETIQHTLYQGMFAPTLLFGGLVYAVFRNAREGCEDPSPPTDPSTEPQEDRHD